MSTLPLYPRILLILASAATLTPIFGGYLIGMLLLLWLMWSWRRGGAAQVETPEAAAIKHLTLPVHVGVLALVSTHVAAAVVGWLLSPFSMPLYDVARVAVRMAIKWGLLWFVLSGAMSMAIRKGWAMRDIGLWLAGFTLITLVYSVAQRYTGIDWTKGFGAMLGPHRHAYGVYRVSAFMGHPLTLAYNLMLTVFAAGSMAWPLCQKSDAGERRAWIVVLAAAFAILLISGSRFVLLILPVGIVIGAGPLLVGHLKRFWHWVVAGFAGFAAFLWWEGSIVGRFGEFFDQNVPLVERFPRLVFWQVHWRMFLDHPLAGVTLAGVDQAMEAYYSAIGRRDMINTAHNVFLQALADSGVLGLAGILALLAGMAVSARRARRLLGRSPGIQLLPIAIILSGLMQNNLRDSEFLFALWFFLALTLSRVAFLARHSFPELHERKPPQDLQPRASRPDPA